MKKVTKRAAIWTAISFIPLVGQIWWTYRVSRHVVEKEKEIKKGLSKT